jgi:hypothetical protein
MRHINLFDQFTPVSENMKYHIDNNISVLENVFRPHSDSFYELIREARTLWDNKQVEVSDHDRLLFENTDLGYFVEFEGEIVPLDLPIENVSEINEEKKGESKKPIGKPMRSSGPKKYKVYVRNPKTGKIKQINFGDVKGGLSAKVSDPKARSSFAKRHKCHLKKDRMTPGYWACRSNRYANLWGGKTYGGYW